MVLPFAEKNFEGLDSPRPPKSEHTRLILPCYLPVFLLNSYSSESIHKSYFN